MSTSLRKRTITILLLLMLFAWISSAVLTVLASSQVLIDQLDRQLNQYSDMVWYMTQVFSRQDRDELAASGLSASVSDDGELPLLIQGSAREELAPALNIWRGNQLVATLEHSPRFEQPQKEGFSFQPAPEGGDGGWRILVRYDAETDLWLLVGIDLERASWALLGIFGRALFPLLVVLPLTVLVLYLGVSRGLRPLQRLATEISERNPRVLEPVAYDDVPAEIEPVVVSLNQLLDRLAAALESEQRFTANAAHELMTPLAAIKTEVQLCQRQAIDEQNRDMLARIVARVDRAVHTVKQLLTLARLDPESPLPAQPVDLRLQLSDIFRETGHVAADRSVQVQLPDGDGPPAIISGNAEALAILCRNLLINAFRYATVNSAVHIALNPSAAQLVLTVRNDCEPIATPEYARLQRRFYRIPGSADTGAGLGLSIVARVARLHRATLHIGPDADGQGFVVSVTFPVAGN